jgi:hypothetical protein
VVDPRKSGVKRAYAFSDTSDVIDVQRCPKAFGELRGRDVPAVKLAVSAHERLGQ